MTTPNTPIEINDEISIRHPGGRPADPVWQHFEKSPLATSAGHFSAKCLYCNKFMTRGRPVELRIHLAKNCQKCNDEIRFKYLTMIVADSNEDDLAEKRNESNKRSRIEQTTLDDHWDDNAEIPEFRKKVIDRAWLKAFVSCGIPFSIIENPFFIDAIKTLRSSYNPPSRNYLSGNLLDHEVIKINNKVNNIFKNLDNFTLGMYNNI